MIVANIIDEDIHEILESYYDLIGFSEEERGFERARCGLALIAHTVELMEDIEEERQRGEVDVF